MNGLQISVKEKDYADNVVTVLVLFVQNVGITQREVGKMGMSIDDAIETLLDTRSYGTADIAKSVAIETMRKYQKIEQIYKRFQKDGGYYHHMAWLDVMEVIEDGNSGI